MCFYGWFLYGPDKHYCGSHQSTFSSLILIKQNKVSPRPWHSELPPQDWAFVTTFFLLNLTSPTFTFLTQFLFLFSSYNRISFFIFSDPHLTVIIVSLFCVTFVICFCESVGSLLYFQSRLSAQTFLSFYCYRIQPAKLPAFLLQTTLEFNYCMFTSTDYPSGVVKRPHNQPPIHAG